MLTLEGVCPPTNIHLLKEPSAPPLPLPVDKSPKSVALPVVAKVIWSITFPPAGS